jgi:hypothetical protein
MWTRRFVMLSDEFSFTANGAPWPNHEWLTDIIFYAIYRIAGLPGLTLFAAAAVTSAVALAWRLMTGNAMQRLIVMAFAMTSMVPVWTVRPHVFTLVLLMIVLHLALRERYWPIPVLFFVWANLHGGVALGFVALGGVMLGRFYTSGLSRLRPLLLAASVAFAATFITPLGASLWWTIPESVHKSTMNQIIEWRAPSPSDATYLTFWVTVLVFPVSIWVFRRSIRSNDHIVLIAVALALMPLALRYRRNVPPFLLVAAPALAHTLAGWLRAWTMPPKRENPTRNVVVCVGCAIFCFLIVAAAWSRPAARLKWQPIPQAVVDEVQACGERVYNAYPDGGYLIWFAPRVRVFIDSRQDPYPLSFTQEYIQVEKTGNYRPVFDRYAIECAVLPQSSLTATRLQADGWRVRVQSHGWLVLQAAGDRKG